MIDTIEVSRLKKVSDGKRRGWLLAIREKTEAKIQCLWSADSLRVM